MSEHYPWGNSKSFFALLREVEKPGRYVGGEWNARRKDPGATRVKVALVFPDLYEVGMSYLGQKILYHVLNSQQDILAERVFAVWPDMEAQLRRRGWPLFSLENQLPLAAFDVVGFSLLYELNYSNILTILELGQIPLRAAERGDKDPLVMAGGTAVFNPEPVAPFFDIIFVGDGEEAVLEIVRTFVDRRDSGWPRRRILQALAAVEGVYVPQFYEALPAASSRLLKPHPKEITVPPAIRKRLLADFPLDSFPVSLIVPNIQVIHDRVAMEVARGCPQRCRFCQATSVYFPFRLRKPEDVLNTVVQSLESTGYEDCSLTALSVSDYPHFEDLVYNLMTALAERRVSLSLSSLRPSGLTEGAAKNILRVRKTGFTTVPEAGTEKLRRVINKNLKDADVLRAAEVAFSRGWYLLKLYFMVGLPTETEEDLNGLVRLTREVFDLGRKILGRPPQINLSLSAFIPKPHTPFQWLAMASPEELAKKIAFVKARLRPYPSVRIKDRPIEMSLLEAAFSRGDRRLADVLETAWKKGARFDGWIDCFNFSLWKESFESQGLAISDYLGSLSLDAALPWDIILTGIKKEYLKTELEKALRAEPTPSCFEAKCAACRGCDHPELFKPRRGPSVVPRKEALRYDNKPAAREVYRYLALFEKKGRMRFLSHLDVMRTIARSLRRSRVPVAFSQGFHPKMLLSFPPPLALGMEGFRECFEFRTNQRLSTQELLPAINSYMPAGLKFLQIKLVPKDAPSLSRWLKAAVYSLDLKEPEVEEAVRRGWRQEIPPADMPAWFKRKIEEVYPRLEPGEAIWIDDSSRLWLRLPLASSGVRPQNFLAKILKLEGVEFHLGREGFIFEGDEDKN